LHLVLQILGQKYLTIFPVTGSFFAHRLIGFAKTHVAHCLTCVLLKRKVLLSSHSSLLPVGGGIDDAEGNAVGNAAGDLDLHLVLQILGQKYLTIFPVTGSFFAHRLIGFAITHVAHCLTCVLLKRKVLLSSHSPLLSVGEVVGNAEGNAVINAAGDLDLHLVLQIVGQKYLTIFPVTGSFFAHRLIGFVKTHVAHCLACVLLKRNALLSSHSPLLLVGEVVNNADTMGNSVGVFVGVVVIDRVVGTGVSSLGLAVGSNVVGDGVV
jgi:hypothetical protein